MRDRLKCILGLVGYLLPAAAVAVSPPHLIADLVTSPSPTEGSSPASFATVESRVLFAAQPGDHAGRLLRSDGSRAGTEEIGDACGALGSGGFELRFATPTQAYYEANCGDGRESLWVSDGTVEGTQALLGAGQYHSPGPFIDVPQWVEEGAIELFLQGGNYQSRLELWRTDGTVAGTISLGSLSFGESVTAAIYRRGPADLLILVEERFQSIAIWRSDGTAAGTSQVETLDFDGSYSSLRSVAPTATGIAFLVGLGDPSRTELWHSNGNAAGTGRLAELSYGVTDALVPWSGAVYVVAPFEGAEWIWRSDGTSASTRPIVDLGHVGNSAFTAASDSFHFLGDRVYFDSCRADLKLCNLMRAPLVGGAAETIEEVCAADYCYTPTSEYWVRSASGRLVFSRRVGETVEVWTSAPDGTGALFVAPLCPVDHCFGSQVGPLALGGRIFFAAVSANGAQRELWSSDGSPAGTIRHAGPLPAISWFAPGAPKAPIAALPGDSGWLFAAGDEVHGLELWRALPQADAGSLVADLRLDRPGLTGLEPVATVGSTLVFSLLDDSATFRTLYRHEIGVDGAEPFLTVPVRRGRHGIRNLPPTLRPAGNAWFFIENDLGDEERFAEQIWRYDPVSRDLRALFAEDPQLTGIGARADDLLPSGADFLFLGSTDPQLRPAIYRLRPRSGAISKLIDLPASDAASIGRSGQKWFLVEDGQRVVAIDLVRRTRTVLDDFPDAFIGQAVALSDGLLFAVDRFAGQGGEVFELRQSPGVGTALVEQWPASDDGCPIYLGLPPEGTAIPALFAVQTYCASAAAELWISDGSFDRTRRLRSFPAARLDFAPRADRLHGRLYFLASPSIEFPQSPSYAIWTTDGTPAGTREAVVLPQGGDVGPYDWTAGARGAEAIYFAWATSEEGKELWRTDGTAAGTRIVADLEPGPASSAPQQLRAVGDQVIFRAGTSASGRELWQVDGDDSTPRPVADLYPGIESSDPWVLAEGDEALYFQADDGVVGREIWEVSRPSVAPCVPDASTLCLAHGRFRARAVRRDFAGELGAAGVVPLTPESGYFWFFAPGNPEVLLKIVDACGLPGFGNFWAYSTGLTNVEVELEIVDTASGERKVVRTALGEAFSPLYDSGSFQVCDAAGGAGAVAGPSASSVSAGSSTVLPLLGGRFEARASWEKRDGTNGIATAVPIAADSGFFWFFDPAIVEVLVKLVDACGFDGFDNFWVFAGGLTDVEVHLEVTDTWSGETVRQDTLQGQPFPTLLESGRMRVCAAPAP